MPGPTRKNPAVAKAHAFLAAYRLNGDVTASAAAVGIDRAMHYRWLRNAAYARDFAQADIDYGTDLEAVAKRIAKDGNLEPVFWQGQACGVVRKFYPNFMIRMLERFKAREYARFLKAEVTGSIDVHNVERVDALSDEELRTLIALHRKMGDNAR